MKERGKAGHSGSATAPLVRRIGAMQNKEEVVFQKMRHLVDDHVARTVAIERILGFKPAYSRFARGRFQETDG
jgi:hypothetical protein